MTENPGIEAARRLAHMGYRFTVNGETIRGKYEGPGAPDPAQVRPLLALVKEHKRQVLSYLAQKPETKERVLTCFDCRHFRPAVNSPNPTQAFGLCEWRRPRGRYGVSTACKYILEAAHDHN